MSSSRLLSLALLGATCCANAQAPLDQRFVFFSLGRSYPVLGARDSRLGAELGFQRVFYEPKLRFLGKNFRTVDTLELMGHKGQDGRYGVDPTVAVGGTYGLRALIGPGGRFFAEGSSGIQFDDVRSHDLPSVFNFNPTISFGEVIPGKSPIELAIRLTHLSNLYTARPNFGQDFIFATIGFSF